ncbi:MAG: hypothetical protein H0T92_11165 [Pyrinomonadaceae bacterium]|nr:hypothetical protein [Pyrinomonadaceae bacterium]
MSSNRVGTSSDQKRCFVVMGFGIKTDFATGRKLDLDKSYRLLIKPVVEEMGLICIRADEIRHSGTIDVPMYQELLTADVVIDNLSTANANALYELGIRHALRARTTIVISENKLHYPFDLNHVVITSYTHLGDAIDFDEVMRFRRILGDTLEAVLRDQNTALVQIGSQVEIGSHILWKGHRSFSISCMQLKFCTRATQRITES